jgi:hypothetical protein
LKNRWCTIFILPDDVWFLNRITEVTIAAIAANKTNTPNIKHIWTVKEELCCTATDWLFDGISSNSELSIA